MFAGLTSGQSTGTAPTREAVCRAGVLAETPSQAAAGREMLVRALEWANYRVHPCVGHEGVMQTSARKMALTSEGGLSSWMAPR